MPYNLGCSFYFDKKRALATGIATSGAGVGLTLMPGLASYVNSNYGWRRVCWVSSALNFVIFLCSFLYRPLKKQRVEAPEDPNIAEADKKADYFKSSQMESSMQKQCEMMVDFNQRISVSSRLVHYEFWLLPIWIDKKIKYREESESLGSRISRRSSISEVVLDVVVTSTQSQSAGSKLQRLLGLANLKDPRSSQFTQLIFCPSIARREAALGQASNLDILKKPQNSRKKLKVSANCDTK